MVNVIVTALIFFAACATIAPAARSDFESRLLPIVRPYSFSIARWQVQTVVGEVVPSLFRRETDGGDVSTVLEYFACVEQARELQYRLDAIRWGYPGDAPAIETRLEELRQRQKTLAATVERVLERQIRETLAAQGIFNPLVGLRTIFPPVNMILARPPHLLVVSPRDRIEPISRTMLQPDLTVTQMEDIEARTDRLGVSSLVTGIGGLGATFPTFVANDMGLRETVGTAVEEWLHQYLTFRPLGFLYVLDLVGVARNYDIARMNETLAGIVSKEISDLVCERYYGLPPSPKTPVPDEREGGTGAGGEAVFDFNREMREIRRAVDTYLARGQIEEAEAFMNARRAYLAENGYHIRKLNQAYFAFHGSYADSPTSIDPIGAEMKKLRSEAGSLKEFLGRVSAMTSREALRKASEAR